MERSTVLVTGATGFVGSWLVDKLNGLGSNVKALNQERAVIQKI